MEDKHISGDESLNIINKMIYEAKGYFYETGVPVLIYGFSIFICTTLSWLYDTGRMQFPFAPFYLMVPVFVVQSFVQLKEDRKKKVKTFTDEAIDFVWIGFFLAVIASFSAFFAGAHYIVITIALFLLGFAAFITGALSKFRYHMVCGVVCLVLAGITFFFQSPDIYFFLAFATILVWIIPGFILRAHFKKLYGKNIDVKNKMEV